MFLLPKSDLCKIKVTLSQLILLCRSCISCLVDEAVEYAYNAIMTNHGQNCCAGSRTFVQEEIYDEFVAKASVRASKRKVGNPWEEGVEHGPQVHLFEKGNGNVF